MLVLHLDFYPFAQVPRLLYLVHRLDQVEALLGLDIEDVFLESVDALEAAEPELVDGQLLVLTVGYQLDLAVVFHYHVELPENLQEPNFLLLALELF